MPPKSFPPELVNRVRNLNLVEVLSSLCTYVTQDKTYEPRRNERSQLYVAEVNGRRFNNLLITEARWFDLDAKKGGGGAIDLTMHLMKVNFVQAVKLLSALETQDTE